MKKAVGKSNGKKNDLKRKDAFDNCKEWKVDEISAGPSRKIKKLSRSENEEKGSPSLTSQATPSFMDNLTHQSFITEFAKNFSRKNAFKSPNAELINEPFQVATIDNLMKDKSLIPKLVKEIETMLWTRKQMDLYEFYQTIDLANVQTHHLAQFYSFLNTDVKKWMQQLTGMKFAKISASCSMYNCGDFLLTHDDLLSDRLIAFVYYLTPWDDKKKWGESMGGALELFPTDIDGQPMFPVAKKIFPSNNQFVFFKVEKKSYHQVGEVLTKEFPRLTINGWFHGFKNNVDYDADAVKLKKPNALTFKLPRSDEQNLSKLINKTYLKDSVKASIQKQIEENSEAALGDFLLGDFIEKVAQELNAKHLTWTTKGPSHQQNYDCLNIDGFHKKSSIKALLEAMTSKAMFKLLHEYTELDLYGPKAKKPKCTVEIQRWNGGCYTLIGDPTSYNNDTLDLILYIGSNDNAGVITYLTPEEDSADNESTASSEEADEPVLLTIFPQNNFLNIVYRSKGTAKFTKYCSKSSIMKTEFNYILFYEFSRILSTISYIVVIFAIGVPMWWKATEIHRASLPSSEIASLDDAPITFTMNIGMFIGSDDRRKKLSEQLESLFNSNDIFKARIIGVNVPLSETANIKTPVKLAQIVTKHHPVKPGDLLVVEWKHLEDEVLVTSDTTVFISDKIGADKLYQVIRTWIVRDYKIRSILGRVKTFDGKQLRHNFPPPSPEYEVLISILNPRPDLQTLHWNVKQASERYLRPFFNEFSELSKFTLKSQWKYQMELKYGSQQIKDNTKMGRHFSMEHDSLPHIITSIERKLGTDVANKPCIHLVVYAPPCQVAPVYIYKDGQRVSNHSFDSFISAKWGGIVIANPSDAVCSSAKEDEVQQVHIHSHEVMDFVLYELRKIFELEVEVPLTSAAMENLAQISPRLWEKDMHLRNGAIHLITSASSTLQSLIKLLDDIKNIVIGDHVAAEIHKAYRNVVLAKQHLLVNDIHQSVKYAREAFISAEKAFNDPSLLELLYFPEEQKYAIYIPLYLPIMIPVIFSLSAVKKYFKKKKEEEPQSESE